MNLTAEYDNRGRVAEHPAIIANWHRDAEAYRREARADIDLAYGAAPRNRYDVFHPARDSQGPLVVFIHGGYWRSFDKSVFSHMAAGANRHGLDVAVPSYSLCPEVTVPDIIDELRQCCLHLHRTHGRQLVVTGHSAGGHLAACLAATDWTAYGAPSNLIKAGLSVSGVFDLRPLIVTPHNDDLRLTAASALAASPLCWPMPKPCPFDLWVGADESAEFLRQSLSLSAAWTGLGVAAPYVELAGKNHFTAPNGLADAASLLTRRLVDLSHA
ncbi:MAG: alpha/beta hydrolase [Hyphomicrobiales bacterium]